MHGRPAKGVAVVACIKARINVESLFGLRSGDAHIIRNAGGIVTDDVVITLGAFADVDDDLRRALAVIRSSRFLPAHDEVRVFVYDVSDATLREVI